MIGIMHNVKIIKDADLLSLFRRKASPQKQVVLVVHQHALTVIVAEVRNGALTLLLNDMVALERRSVADAIQQAITTYPRHLVKGSVVTVVLNVQQYQSILIDRPSLPTDEISASLKYTLRELVPLEPSVMVTDFYELPLQPAGHDKITAVIADKQRLQPIVDKLIALDFELQTIAIEELLLAQFFEHSDDAKLILYQVDGAPLVIQIIINGQMIVSRQVRGYEQIAELTEADIQAGRLDGLIVEMQRSLDFYEGQLRQGGVKEVICAFVCRHPQDVASYISEQLNYQVSFAEYPNWSVELAAQDYTDITGLGALQSLVSLPRQPSALQSSPLEAV